MANYFENFGVQQYGDKLEISRKITTRANIAQSVNMDQLLKPKQKPNIMKSCGRGMIAKLVSMLIHH